MLGSKPVCSSVSQPVYLAEQVRSGERLVAADLGIEMYSLMESAGGAAFRQVQQFWPEATRILVCCGGGNNGGDGYIVATLAHEAGIDVTVWSTSDPERLKGDAEKACRRWRDTGGEIGTPQQVLPEVDLVVDAIFGIGLDRPVEGLIRDLICAINESGRPVLAVDLPSGLHADTGSVLGVAVKAAVTVSFIALKAGLLTGKGREHCGTVIYEDLGIGDAFETAFSPDMFVLTDFTMSPRQRAAHKGDFGRLLCIGGNKGMMGAIMLACDAAIRSGAGLVAAGTREENRPYLTLHRPEVMAPLSEHLEAGLPPLNWATCLAVGPGLGQDEWSVSTLSAALESKLPVVLDADALNLLAAKPSKVTQAVLTPHPGEAARLLGCSVCEIESDRISAARSLFDKFGAVIVLKGAGTIVYDGDKLNIICAGNPGMASAGMGDVLTGIIGALWAQGLSGADAALYGAMAHAKAGDLAARQGERGLLASDVIQQLRNVLNQI